MCSVPLFDCFFSSFFFVCVYISIYIYVDLRYDISEVTHRSKKIPSGGRLAAQSASTTSAKKNTKHKPTGELYPHHPWQYIACVKIISVRTT